MKRVLLHLIILILVFSCGTKIVIYNNKSENPKKEVKSKKEKQRKKKSKNLVVTVPKILNTEDYVKYYSSIAMDEMIQFSIPASITLAQGILESGYGQGTLAKKANNHFGIKCHKGWKGKSISHDDDEKGECFRSYKNPLRSYKDHSLFLVERDRYSSLFKLNRKDYRSWAIGLKAAGYATDPKYAEKLISLIERYKLNRFDE